MTLAETMAALKKMADAQNLKTMLRHGAPADAIYGVKIGDMKTLVKKIKVDHDLALALYATGISDAQYLAALIADDKKFSKKELQTWADGATWHMISDWSVPWVAAGSNHGFEMAAKWIDAKSAVMQCSGWATFSAMAGHYPDDELDLKVLEKLMVRVGKTIHSQANRVKYWMNAFVIAVGASVESLNELALETAAKIGKVEVDMGDTSCKTPDATEYIRKVMNAGRLGHKRKMLKC